MNSKKIVSIILVIVMAYHEALQLYNGSHSEPEPKEDHEDIPHIHDCSQCFDGVRMIENLIKGATNQ